MAKVTKRESAFMAYFPTSLLVVIGAILLGFSGGSPTLISIACVLSFAGINIYLTYHWIILGNHAMQSDLPAHLIYGGGFLALALGAILGTGIGSILNATATYDTWAEHFAIVLIALAFFAPFLIANGASLAGETKRMGGTPYGQTVTSEEERVDVAAKHFGLTSREKEILLLLYQGRSVPYICNELFIAESTVRTHLKHIYAKAEIGSRQDLIDAIRNL